MASKRKWVVEAILERPRETGPRTARVRVLADDEAGAQAMAAEILRTQGVTARTMTATEAEPA